MANLAITSKCNRHCAYCFAGTLGEEVHMDRHTYRNALDFLQESGINQVRLLGGEPSQHPDFIWFVKEALERYFKVLIFSNGLIAPEHLHILANISNNQLAILININSPSAQKSSETHQQLQTLEICGEKVTLGFNIHSPCCSLDFLFPLINQYQLSRTVRLGLAHPCIGRANTSLHPKHYSKVGMSVAQFMISAMAQEVTVELDCGFVPCMFPAKFLRNNEILLSQTGIRCGPIPDILPDGMSVHCYPLRSCLQLDPFKRKTSTQVKTDFTSLFKLYRKAGVYPQCATCTYRMSGQCTGGCLSATIHRFHNTQTSLSFLSIPDASGSNCNKRVDSEKTQIDADHNQTPRNHPLLVLPYIDQPGDFWLTLFEDFGPYIKEVYCPLSSQIMGSGRPVQPSKYLLDFLKNFSGCCSVLLNPITLSQPVEELAPRVLEELRYVHGEWGISRVTISNLNLASLIKESLPFFELTASVLMDISTPVQAMMINGICDNLVPASRIMRNLPALQALQSAFNGRIRLMVNEACLPGCPFRTQHFHEMGSDYPKPRSLCEDLLKKNEWMRLTGSWVLPQHLHLYKGLWDEIKLAGRVTLQNTNHYRKVLSAYINETPLSPNEIGGGPASLHQSMTIEELFFKKTLSCKQQCHNCSICRDYFNKFTIATHEN